MSAANPDLDQFVAKSLKRAWATVPPAAISDLKRFAAHAAKGRVISWEGLRHWMRENHKINPGRTRLATVAREHGVTPWWSNASAQ